MWSQFQQNRSKIVEVRDDHRQTDTQTYTHSHRRTDRDRPEMTEYYYSQVYFLIRDQIFPSRL